MSLDYYVVLVKQSIVDRSRDTNTKGKSHRLLFNVVEYVRAFTISCVDSFLRDIITLATRRSFSIALNDPSTIQRHVSMSASRPNDLSVAWCQKMWFGCSWEWSWSKRSEEGSRVERIPLVCEKFGDSPCQAWFSPVGQWTLSTKFAVATCRRITVGTLAPSP